MQQLDICSKVGAFWGLVVTIVFILSAIPQKDTMPILVGIVVVTVILALYFAGEASRDPLIGICINSGIGVAVGCHIVADSKALPIWAFFMLASLYTVQLTVKQAWWPIVARLVPTWLCVAGAVRCYVSFFRH